MQPCAHAVLLGPTIRASVVIENHCRYSYDLVVSETADSSSADSVRFSVSEWASLLRALDSSDTPLRSLQSLLMLHPSLAPLVVLGQIRQGTVIEVGVYTPLLLLWHRLPAQPTPADQCRVAADAVKPWQQQHSHIGDDHAAANRGF